VSKIFSNCGVDLYRSRGWRDAVASSQQALTVPRSTTALRIGNASDLRSSALQLCISPFIGGKYDFTSQFI
jgi:hypothetical protein